jgi:hypothetical protein
MICFMAVCVTKNMFQKAKVIRFCEKMLETAKFFVFVHALEALFDRSVDWGLGEEKDY